MMFSLAGRNAFVTGAAGGLGAAICHALVSRGARVAVADMRIEMATGVSNRIAEQAGPDSSIAVRLDVADEASVELAIAEATERLGAPDILINAAGIAQLVRFETSSTADWRRMLGVHLDGTFFCTRRAIGPMLTRGYGRVICFSSIVATAGAAYETHYAAAKAGIEGLVRALSREVASRGVTVNAIAPGFFDTPINDISSEAEIAEIRQNILVGRLGTPAEVAALTVYLASDEAAYLTGQVINLNGGMSYGRVDQQVGDGLD
jgi:3-oxoacyl-[acyl-carrier protein] reductase